MTTCRRVSYAVLMGLWAGCGGAAGTGGAAGMAAAAGTGGVSMGGSSGAGGAPAAAEDAGARDSGPPADGPRGGTGGAPATSGWTNATGNLAGMASECGNLTMVSGRPDKATIIAGVARKGLWASDDGRSWRALGTGAGSATITNRPTSITYDPKDADIFWESGIYNGPGVYKTTDGGLTFKQLGNIRHNDYVTVDFTDPERKTLVAGGHEQKRTLFRSTDAGSTWTNIGLNLPADSHFSSVPFAFDATTHLLGACGYGSGTCGIWRTTDGGATWTQVSSQGAVGDPLVTRGGALLWPIIYNRGLLRSTDQGQQWTMATGGGTLASGHMVELPDGRLVAVGAKQLLISSDGSAWKAFGDPLPYQPGGVAYSAASKTFFVWRNDCGNAVLLNAIMSTGFEGAK